MKSEIKQDLEIPKVQKSAPKHRLKNFLVRMKNNYNIRKARFRQKVNKFKSFFKNDIIMLLVFHGLVYGSILNYTLWIIFNIPFTWYGFPAYGIFLYLIESEFMQIWKDLWFRSER